MFATDDWKELSVTFAQDKGPENENQAGAGTLIVGLAEIGGATLLARAGGRQAATGMSK